MARTPNPAPAAPEGAAERAGSVIRKYVLLSMGCGFIPAALVDIVAVTALEVQMIQELSRVYAFRFPRGLVLYKILLSLLGSIAPFYLTNNVRSLLKVVPFLSHLALSGTFAAVNGACVYAVGRVFQRHFESGGTFLSSDNAVLRAFFEEKYAEGIREAAAIDTTS